MDKKVVIYTTPGCPYCKMTKEWLGEHSIPYDEIDVSEDERAAERMIEESGQMGVPVWKVIVEGKEKRLVIGYDEDALEEEFT